MPLKFEFWRTFPEAQLYKKAPKFKFQQKSPLPGRKFVAEMEDEISSGQKSKPFREKATFTTRPLQDYVDSKLCQNCL